MSEITEGLIARKQVEILKIAYYMLLERGEGQGARALAEALFELTAGEAEAGIPSFPWSLYIPRSGRKPENGWEPGLRMLEEGRNDEALAFFEGVLWEQGSLHFNTGLALFRLGRYEEAFAHFQDAVKISPSDPEYLNLLGQTYEELGSPEEAELALLKSLKADPDYAMSYYDLGVIIAKRRTRDAEARVLFDRAIALDPSLGWAYYCLACLDALEGKKGAALGYLKAAFEKGVRDKRHIAKDSDLDSLRGEAAFQGLMKKYFSNEGRS